MNENAIDSESISKPAPDTAKPKGARKAGKKATAKRATRAKKPAAKSKADRTNFPTSSCGTNTGRHCEAKPPRFHIRQLSVGENINRIPRVIGRNLFFDWAIKSTREE
jgi:hypothetical protein